MTQSQDPFNRNTSPHDSSGNTGMIMMFAGWILFFVLMLMFFSHLQKPRVEARITSTGERIVVLYRKNNQYLSTGKINGVDVIYLIDTGATGVSVPTKVARKAGLRAGPKTAIITANGMRSAYLTKIDKLQLGPITVRNVPAHINDGLTDNQVLLGIHVLRKLDIRIKGNTMTLRQAAQH